MKNIFLLLLISSAYAQDVWVNGYVKDNGSYVQSHHRTRPDNTQYNNYSTVGNVNPYTGKAGYIQPTYGTVSTSINLPLVQQVLSTKQSAYKQNSTRVANILDEMNTILNTSSLTNENKNRIRAKFYSRYLQPMYLKNYDFSDTSLTNSVINWLHGGLKSIVSEEESNYKNLSLAGSYVKLNRRAVLWDVPNMAISNSLGDIPSLEVYVIERSNDIFYKIKSRNKVGYITAVNFDY